VLTSTLQRGRAQMSAEILTTNASRPQILGLQRGRAQMSAEILTTNASRPQILGLQRGRAQMSAEMSLPAQCDSGTS